MAPVELGVTTGRSIEERLLLWLPRPVVDVLLRRAVGLPIGSPLRRRLFKRALVRGWETTMRGDIFEVGYEPTAELRVVGVVVGLAERHEGIPAVVQACKT